MSKIICSPGSYVQGKGEFARLSTYAKTIGAAEAYVIISRSMKKAYGAVIEKGFADGGLKCRLVEFNGECCESEIKRHGDGLAGADLVIGVGGGKVLDTAKAVGYHAKRPVMVVPTIASTDAPCSRLSVIYKENGEFDKYLPLPKNPDIVVMDTAVIAKAPARFLASGIGDALATYYEAAACVRSDVITLSGGHVTNAAITLARLCLDLLHRDGRQAMAAARQGVVTKALENIVEANTYLSGIGFESSGLAAAHAVHNGLTVLPQCHGKLHGEKVAFGALTELVLENRSLEEIEKSVALCKDVGLPTTFADLGLAGVGDADLMKVAEASCAEGDTMVNMPFEVTPEDVVAAMKTADALGK